MYSQAPPGEQEASYLKRGKMPAGGAVAPCSSANLVF